MLGMNAMLLFSKHEEKFLTYFFFLEPDWEMRSFEDQGLQCRRDK